MTLFGKAIYLWPSLGRQGIVTIRNDPLWKSKAFCVHRAGSTLICHTLMVVSACSVVFRYSKVKLRLTSRLGGLTALYGIGNNSLEGGSSLLQNYHNIFICGNEIEVYCKYVEWYNKTKWSSVLFHISDMLRH